MIGSFEVSVTMREVQASDGAKLPSINAYLNVFTSKVSIWAEGRQLGVFRWDHRRGRFVRLIGFDTDSPRRNNVIQDELEKQLRASLEAAVKAANSASRRGRVVEMGMTSLVIGKPAEAGGAFGDMEKEYRRYKKPALQLVKTEPALEAAE